MSWHCVQTSWHVVVPWKSEILKQRDPKTWEMACQGANHGDHTTHLRNNVGTRVPVTLSWEQGSWDKTFSSSPIHSPCVGLCDPGAPCTQASPRGKRNAKDWRSVTLPVSSWGAGLGLPVKLGREGIAVELLTGGLTRSGAVLVPKGCLACQQCVGRTRAVASSSPPGHCSISFLCGSI